MISPICNALAVATTKCPDIIGEMYRLHYDTLEPAARVAALKTALNASIALVAAIQEAAKDEIARTNSAPILAHASE